MALTGLQKLANAIEAFQPESEVEKIVRSNTRQLQDLQKEQLAEGKDAQGGAIRWHGRQIYSPYTIAKKQHYGVGLGAVTDHFTLYSSGDFYKQLAAYVKGNKLTFKSSVPYFNRVIESAGDVVLGLNEESRKAFYKNVLWFEFKKVFKEKTGIKLST